MSEFKIYNLRIVPPNPVFDEVTYFKSQFIEQFGKQRYSKSKPHITLAHFTSDIQYQDILINAFSELSNFKRFKLALQGFDIFKQGKVLLLRVEMVEEIKNIHKQIQYLWPKESLKEQKLPYISKTPHMTISKTKNDSMLNDSLAFFQKIDYQKQFEVSHLTLVSRAYYKTWDWHYEIELE
ncbi:MAG: 2'-5' RNA ligase family protein [Flavobacteriaceae bacterium]|nr:2'-5' RNA ligase family protein [Flavobacteriaceae bacterium]